ncbi:insecticidal delta-endotoxin Cry8Ea1 family protein [Burkholderia sp. Ac-20344]|uniref:insecticidal delta-endotoxin Cry8Ea1 family protein n=1 Tax=Burkholderia sp. Ac-20344 TaxID=2703890 RepID=UPI00197CAD49|nr:insecticidal delta-endotoxin Cry8Ea1 family protein [Burkholderia sp. Ac-20344]MBN3837281.1 hypothetical protein [Burkholderia sp. Ac-20344]
MPDRLDRRAFLKYGACSAVMPILAACSDHVTARTATSPNDGVNRMNSIAPPGEFDESNLLIPGFRRKFGEIKTAIEQYQPAAMQMAEVVKSIVSGNTLQGTIAFGEFAVQALALFIPEMGFVCGVMNLLFNQLVASFDQKDRDQETVIRRIATDEISKNNLEIMRGVLTGINRVLDDFNRFVQSVPPPYSRSMIDNITAKFEAFVSICTQQIPLFLIKGSEYQGLTMHALAASAQLSMYGAYLSIRRELALAPDTVGAVLHEMKRKIHDYQNCMQAVLARRLSALSDPAQKNDYIRNFYTLGYGTFLASAKTYFATLHETKIEFRNSMEIYMNDVVRDIADATLPSRTSFVTDLSAVCHCGSGPAHEPLVVRLNQAFVDGAGRVTHIEAQGCTGDFAGVSGGVLEIAHSFGANQSKGELTDGRGCIWKAATRTFGPGSSLHAFELQDGMGVRYSAASDAYGNAVPMVDDPKWAQSYTAGNSEKCEPGYYVSSFLTRPGTYSGKTCREDSGNSFPFGGVALRHYTSIAQLAELKSADTGLELDLTCGFSTADSLTFGAPTGYPDVMIGKSILVGKRLMFVVTNRTSAPIGCRLVPLLADVKMTSDTFVNLTLLAPDKSRVLGKATLVAAPDSEPALLGEDGRKFVYYETNDIFAFQPGVNYVTVARNADLGNNAFRFASLLIVPTRV